MNEPTHHRDSPSSDPQATSAIHLRPVTKLKLEPRLRRSQQHPTHVHGSQPPPFGPETTQVSTIMDYHQRMDMWCSDPTSRPPAASPHHVGSRGGKQAEREAHRFNVQEAQLTSLRQSFEAARSFEDDDLFFRGPGQTTRHHVEEAKRAAEEAMEQQVEERKKEVLKAEACARRGAYQRDYHYVTQVSPTKPCSSAATARNQKVRNSFAEVSCNQTFKQPPGMRFAQAGQVPVTSATDPGYLEGLGEFRAIAVRGGQGHRARGSSGNNSASSGESSFDPAAETFRPKA